MMYLLRLPRVFIFIFIDEERSHVLTKYASTKGVQKKSESDHNILYAKFKIYIHGKQKKERIEIFDLKNPESQQLFLEETNCVQQFRDVFSKDVDIEQNSQQFLKKLNKIIHKCFKKIRITGNVNKKDEMVIYMELKTQLTIKLRITDDDYEISEIKSQIRILDNYLSVKCAEKNKQLVREYSEELVSLKGTFSQHGLWKLKSKLCRKSMDAPMAKVDSNGQFITSPNLLKDLYLRTYCERLRHRVILSKYEDVYEMKTELWQTLLDSCKSRKSEDWQMSDLEKVIQKILKLTRPGIQ